MLSNTNQTFMYVHVGLAERCTVCLCSQAPRENEKKTKRRLYQFFYHVRQLITSVFSVVRLRTFYKSCFENVYNEYYMLHHIMIIKSKQKNFSLVYYSVRHILKSDLKYFGILKWACTNTKEVRPHEAVNSQFIAQCY